MFINVLDVDDPEEKGLSLYGESWTTGWSQLERPTAYGVG